MLRSLVSFVLLFVPAVVFAQSPEAEAQRQKELAKKPQWQRKLSFFDNIKVASRESIIKALVDAGKRVEAAKVAEELLALRREKQGDDHWEVTEARVRLQDLRVERSTEQMSQLQKAYQLNEDGFRTYNQGKYREAGEAWQQALDIQRKIVGEEHPDTARSYNNLAYNLDALGKSAEAAPHYQTALGIFRKVLGEEHPDTAGGYNNVAFNLGARGRSLEAAPYFQRALDIRRNVFGEEHADTAQGYHNLAANLENRGRLAEAAPLYQKALDIFRKVHGEEHTDTATSYNNLAGSLEGQGRAAEAEALRRRALDILRKLLGEEHPSTAAGYNNLAGNLQERGQASEAAPLYRKALEIRRKVLGEEHPDTAVSYNSLARNLERQGRVVDAAPLKQKALDIRRKVLGEEHPETAESYNNLAFNLEAQGQAAEAASHYQKALDIRIRVLGEEHPDTALSYNNLAYNLSVQGQAAEAIRFFEKSLEIRRRILGEEHPDTATTYHNLAGCLEDRRQAAEAGSLFQKALNIRRKVLGEDHPDTSISYNGLACNLRILGKTAEAEAVLNQAIDSVEGSRIALASGIERANLTALNVRLLRAAWRQDRDPRQAWIDTESTLARGILDEGTESTSTLTSAELADASRQRAQLAAIRTRVLKLVTKPQRTVQEEAELQSLLADRKTAEQSITKILVSASTRLIAPAESIQAAIPPDAALILWIDIENESRKVQEHFACIVRSTGNPYWQRLPGNGPDGKWTDDDWALPQKLRTALAGFTPSGDVRSLIEQARALRIAPLLKHLDGVRTLYVTSNRYMAGVAVEVLAPEFTVSYVPSGTYLARMKEQPSLTNQKLLVVADPVFDSPDDTPSTALSLPPGGVLVTQVVPDSAAAKARLHPGDVLLRYGQTELTDLASLQKASSVSPSAETIPVTVWRETVGKTFIQNIAAGRLGVVIAKDPAPIAIASRRKSDKMLLALRGDGWADLPGTRIEANRLRQMFSDSQILLASDASEQQLEELRKSDELSKFRYLHFATHGEGNAVRAFESALILSQDNLPKDPLPRAGDPYMNGQLSAAEVMEYWKLNAEMVTLSACETAVGKATSGDGMLGFAQAFLLAGSRSVCLSLWKVDDTATALLMDRFYRNLLGKREDGAKPMGKAAALHEAKTWLKKLTLAEATDRLGVLTEGVSRGSKKGREVIGEVPAPKDSASDSKPYSHPKYWAAFILIGDPD